MKRPAPETVGAFLLFCLPVLPDRAGSHRLFGTEARQRKDQQPRFWFHQDLRGSRLRSSTGSRFPMQLFSRRPKPAKWPEQFTLEVNGAPVAVAVRVHARARSYRLRLSDGGQAMLTVPSYGHPQEAEAFVHRHRHWLEARLKRAPSARPFVDGALVPFRGVDHRIVATGRVRGTVELVAGDEMPVLRVPGASEHLGRRLIDWLKKQAEHDLSERVAIHAETLGVRPISLSLRGQSTRWGSCSARGRLNFNWRLVLAPPFVLDYVAAHEVAHLREMNHSPAFWATVERALPDYARGRAWLKTHGKELMVQGLDMS
jgi:predicted metal-dependent hydrolase